MYSNYNILENIITLELLFQLSAIILCKIFVYIPAVSVMRFTVTLGGPGDSVTAATEHKYSVLACRKSISILVTAPFVVTFTFNPSSKDFKWTIQCCIIPF